VLQWLNAILYSNCFTISNFVLDGFHPINNHSQRRMCCFRGLSSIQGRRKKMKLFNSYYCPRPNGLSHKSFSPIWKYNSQLISLSSCVVQQLSLCWEMVVGPIALRNHCVVPLKRRCAMVARPCQKNGNGWPTHLM
jgi:hypothetical protein